MISKLGYYTVNNKIFLNKLNAILAANLTSSEITWNFNRDVFDQVDWLTEPTESLDFYYGERARQIREHYDYVIVMASGGADSTNVINSFLNNGFKIDEIIAGAPLSGLSNWKYDASDTSANNTVSETKFAQLPLLDRISNLYPDIKLTIHDYFEDIVNLRSDNWIYESSSHWIHFSGTTRHSLDKFGHIKNLLENGKRVAVVYGIDKPIIKRTENGDLHMIIADSVVNIVTSHFKEKYDTVDSVLFYYDPDLPQLLIKQCHEVCKWIYRPENYQVKILLWDDSKSENFNSNPIRGSRWQRQIVPCIYPSLNHSAKLWQAEKHDLGFKGAAQIDHWVHKLHRDLDFFKYVTGDINGLISQISSKYFVNNNKELGFERFKNSWKIGNERDFLPKSIDSINIK